MTGTLKMVKINTGKNIKILKGTKAAGSIHPVPGPFYKRACEVYSMKRYVQKQKKIEAIVLFTINN